MTEARNITILFKFGITNSDLRLMQDIAIIIVEGDGQSVPTNASEIVSLLCKGFETLSQIKKSFVIYIPLT